MVPGYREVRELGTGGGGRVVLATYTGTGAYVAIKYLNSAMKDDRLSVARFRRDARTLVDLDHPNVVRLYEYYEDVLDAAIVMELVDGVPLRRILSTGGATGPEAALALFKDVLLGLAKAHSRGVVHRGCRPENVLVQADGNTKLSDFGLGAPAGSAAADLYAAARVFLECLTGRAPRPADLAGTPGPALPQAIPGPVWRLVARGTAENPADRPPTARTFAAELDVAALAACGPEWEQRGRRRLAERATLLALDFPLARPAAPPAGPAARAAGRAAGLWRHGQWRSRRPGARLALVAGAAAVAVTAALVAADRPADPLASDAVFTPRPGPDSAGGAGAPEGTAGPRSGSPAPSGATERSRNVAADRPASPRSSAPVRPAATPPPRSVSAVPVNPPPAPPDPTGEARTPAGSPSPTGGPTPPAPRHGVSGLAVAGVDGDGATIALRASTAAEVVLTAGFAEGPDPDRLTEMAARTVTLSGSETYVQRIPHVFADPPCGQTLYRRVTAATSPQAPGGASSLLVEVPGEPCPEPGGSPSGSLSGPPTGDPEGEPESDPGEGPGTDREGGAGDGPPEGPAGDQGQDPAGRDESGGYHTL
ncbi:serine/threonine-protein kinase [Planomonospora venezuelensis]|uniref:Serine/threonine-protein kinase n=1 Tax=Planomonospora venezuelensis TaxID=1999 RepID=A0A841D6U9_PLAVE|nr:serine/threonine-protein kinase [Planomonospora venezuelensis]MBB5965620.1 serine/threonine-protein kinase [Planomonospora venezuelensis]GIN04961.1 hypothetical protein Pve01_66190 [Planomonospora venezuelensis]